MKVVDLLEKIMEMRFSREAVLQDIDSLLDMQYKASDREKIGLENEVIDDKVAKDIMLGFQIETEEKKMAKEDYRIRCDEEIRRQEEDYNEQCLDEENYLKKLNEELK